ncbi:hypothetical protein HanRHA438_Chr17g0827701 [Helianthus annuus]|nr:hypothetical protein HanRHA438_Chr17g0827701 [Helianthus annuus]
MRGSEHIVLFLAHNSRVTIFAIASVTVTTPQFFKHQVFIISCFHHTASSRIIPRTPKFIRILTLTFRSAVQIIFANTRPHSAFFFFLIFAQNSHQMDPIEKSSKI